MSITRGREIVFKQGIVHFKGSALNSFAVFNDAVNVIADYDELAECILYVYYGWYTYENCSVSGDAAAEFSNEDFNGVFAKAAELESQCIVDDVDGTMYVMQLAAADVCDEADDLIEGAYVEEEGATLRLWLSKDYNGESFFAEEDGAEEGDQQGDEE